MTRLRMNDKQWQRIQPMIPDGKPGGRPPLDRRTIIDGILWILRTGAPWRDIPEAFGKWQTVWRLFDQWNGDGTLDKILQKLQGEIIINTELWCIDGTVIRAARCAAGGGKKGTRKSPKITL
jgi:transposase